MDHLRLLLLGPPQIELDGRIVHMDTRKAVALLAYLAVTRANHSRDALATLLWPNYDQASSRGALRRTLSTLKSALDGDWLEVDRETVGLNPATSLFVDLDRFHDALAECQKQTDPLEERSPSCEEPLTRAVALYRDDFMAGFTLRDSPNFDDWQFFQTETLRREFAGALERLVTLYTNLGNYEPAIGYARRWLMLDPLHEPVHRQLMLLYAWSGKRAAALRQYRECVRLLKQELGVVPLEDTTRLHQQIEANQLPPPRLKGKTPEPEARDGAAEPVPISPPAASGLPFVGRAKEWETLGRAYAGSASDGHLLVLEGEAGIGKTRLAEEFLGEARKQGAVVITARAYEGENNLAYGPFIEALRPLLNTPEAARALDRISVHTLSEATRLWPELATLHPGLPPPPTLESPGAQSRFFEGVSQLVLTLAQGAPQPRRARPRPGVLFLDDMQWADSASLDLLTYLVRRLRGNPLLVLVTWRGDQVPTDLQMRQVLNQAQRAGTASVLHLTRLSPEAVRTLVQTAVSAAANSSPTLAAALSDRLYRETEGQPFFVTAYLALVEQGAPSLGGEPWSLPASVRDLLHTRLSHVSETGTQVLSAAAVIGRSFDFDTLRAASGRSEEETVVSLEELVREGLIEEVRGSGEQTPAHDFTHDKLRALVYDETSLPRRRLLHRRVADALVNRSRSRTLGPLAGQIAQHYQRAGMEKEAAEYHKLAGEYVRRLFANAEALEHFRAALAFGHPDTAGLHEAIGDLETLTGDYTAALTSYECGASLGPPAAVARFEHKIGTVHLRRGDYELAESHLQAALAAAGDSQADPLRAQIYADWSLAAFRRGDARRAHQMAEQSLALAHAAGDNRALAQAHNMLGVLARSRGKLDRAIEHLEQSLALAEALDDAGSRSAALNNLALAYRECGELERALRLVEQALALSAAQGDRHREAALHNNLADLLHSAGHTDAAMTHLIHAVTIYAEIGGEGTNWQPEIWKLTEW